MSRPLASLLLVSLLSGCAYQSGMVSQNTPPDQKKPSKQTITMSLPENAPFNPSSTQNASTNASKMISPATGAH